MKLFKKKKQKEEKKEIQNLDIFEELMQDSWDDDVWSDF